MKRLQNNIINYLKNYCYGKENAIRKDELAKVFDISTRELRDIKRDIVIKRGIPIGATSAGYFYASNDIEIMEFRKYYLSLVGEHLKMQKAYENIVNQKDQMSMI